jgi:small subunit ribosomal protein S6
MDTIRRNYETTFIVNSYLEDAQIEAIITKVEETITKNGGVIKIFDKIGRKRLTYPIKKKNNGFYTFILFEATTEITAKIERVYQLEENILRYLTIVLDKKAIAYRLKEAENRKNEAKPAETLAQESATAKSE